MRSIWYHVHTIHYSINDRKFLTKNQSLNDSLRRRVLTNDEKLEFVKTSVSWISSKDKKDNCFILNFGCEVPLPWPQVISEYIKDLLLILITFNNQVRMRLDDEDTGSVQLVPQTHGMDVPSACTIVIIAGKWWHTGGQSKDIYVKQSILQSFHHNNNSGESGKLSV